MNKLKPMPTFESEQEEHEFWKAHDSTDYVNWDKAKEVTFGRLKKTPGEELVKYESHPLFQKIAPIIVDYAKDTGLAGVDETRKVFELILMGLNECLDKAEREE